MGVPAERIQRLDEENYWKMAETGPCGPCSEIFWDRGPEIGDDGAPARGALVALRVREAPPAQELAACRAERGASSSQVALLVLCARFPALQT